MLIYWLIVKEAVENHTFRDGFCDRLCDDLAFAQYCFNNFDGTAIYYCMVQCLSIIVTLVNSNLIIKQKKKAKLVTL